jgi:hypothetical protein
MALKIGLIVVLVIVAFLAYAATRPSEFRLKRTAHVNASPEAIFPHINDFHRWAAWSPFEKLDPAMNRTFSGAPAGKGAVYEREGNKKAGKGRMEIVDSAAPNRVGWTAVAGRRVSGVRRNSKPLDPQQQVTRPRHSNSIPQRSREGERSSASLKTTMLAQDDNRYAARLAGCMRAAAVSAQCNVTSVTSGLAPIRNGIPQYPVPGLM